MKGKQVSTIFLRLSVSLIGIPVLVLCVLGLYKIVSDPINPVYAYILYPIIVVIYLTAIPFFTALYQTFKLLSYIDKNNAFSELSVKALNNIKYCAIAICTLYVIAMPFVYLLAKKDDAPGFIIIAMVPVFASMVIAVFTAVLQRLLKFAIDIKNDNDLTI